MSKWVVYCAGNADYILSPNEEPVKMLKSFQKHFGDELDYVYFTDKDEPNLDLVLVKCKANGIKLMLGECKQHYHKYNDFQSVLEYQQAPRWPDAHFWYCEAPSYFYGTYDYAIKCDGDILCAQKFDLTELEVQNEITAARAPEWYDPYDKFCPNAGFQIMNVSTYANNNVRQLFRDMSDNKDNYRKMNSDTPMLDYLVGKGILNVHFISAEYNYLLFDIDQVKHLKLEDVENVKLIHFVDSKPHNLREEMKGSIKEYFSKIYLKRD